jgi:hypothetical protein
MTGISMKNYNRRFEQVIGPLAIGTLDVLTPSIPLFLLSNRHAHKSWPVEAQGAAKICVGAKPNDSTEATPGPNQADIL